jgi:hypothetical protein
MRTAIAGIVCLVVAGIVALAVGGDSTVVKATSVALLGVACVIAISLAFFAVGRAEDLEREASAPPPEEPPPSAKGETHERQALSRRRPLPPRRPR